MKQRRIMKSSVALIVTICLLMNQTYIVKAEESSTITVEQLGILFDGVESIVIQLKELGLTEEDIHALFSLTPREEDFYQSEIPELIAYTGEFTRTLDEEVIIKSDRSYDGNLPNSDIEQKNRLESIYSTAQKHYKSKYYEGPVDEEDFSAFGDYLTYLYLSHYIDGPGRVPTNNDFPYIITKSDISAYKQFIMSGYTSTLLEGIANLGTAIYANSDYVKTLSSINTIDLKLAKTRNEILLSGADNIHSTKEALKTISPIVTEYIVSHYDIAYNEESLTEETIKYVESKLSLLDFHEQYEDDVVDMLTAIMISTCIAAVCSSVSLIGIIVSAIPLFVYGCTTIFDTAVWVKLQYSFRGRYAVRMGIYYGI